MRIALYTNSISAHQLPLAREIVARVGAENFRYIYTGELQGGAQEVAAKEGWIWEKKVEVERRGGGGERDEGLEEEVRVDSSSSREKELGVRSQEWLENCEVLLSGIRDVELMERRARKGLTTCYMSERWFKPCGKLFDFRLFDCSIRLPGWLRLLVPGYRKMARRIVKLIAESPRFYYLAAGPWAAKDMRSIARSFGISIPEAKIIQWGYFVAPATEESSKVPGESSKVREFESLKVSGESSKVRKFESLKVPGESSKVPGESLKVREFESLKVAGEGSKVREFESLKVAGEGSKVREFESLKVPEESSKVREFESLKVPDSRTFEHSNLQTFKPSNIQTFEPSNVKPQTSNVLRVLWVGRMLDWKRVDTIVRAVARANAVVQANSSSSSTSKAESIDQSNNRTIEQSNLQTFKPSNFQTLTLTLVGDGPEKPRLQKLASKLQTSNAKPQPSNFKPQTSNFKPSNLQTFEPSNLISFLPPVPIGQVRNLMREHDIYVLASNVQEGWGAAVNEALEEGMIVIGTDEAGASAALLPRENLYRAGDWKALARLLQAPEKLNRVVLPREFTPAGAAERLMQLVSSVGLLHTSVI